MSDPRALRSAAGPFVRPLRALVRALASGPATLPELVAASALTRRRVEALLREVADDLVEDGGRYALRPERAAEYAAVFEVGTAEDPAGFWDRALGVDGALVATMAELIAQRPAPDRDLDHVGATPATAARRGRWLADRYDLAAMRLLCVGDHDLTSLAAAATDPAVQVVVVDLDERVLEFIDTTARRRGWSVRCLWGDFRLGLPASAREWADVVFTDPPYTPEGVETFLLAGLQGLRDAERGRLVVAYGYGEHQPALGLKVQQAVQGLHLVHEAVLPDFNAYDGAQAIGSHGDLYVLQPTARTRRAAPTAAERQQVRIYTHGRQSLEGGAQALEEAAVAGALALLDGAGGNAPLIAVTAQPLEDAAPGQHVLLPTLLAQGVPAQLAGRRARALVDLTDAPEPWVLRTLLALNAEAAALLLPPGAQASLAQWRELLRGKYELSAHALPGTALTALLARARPGGGPAARVLARAHGRLGNVAREALVAAARERGRVLTKNAARDLLAEHVRPELLSASLVELPRHQVAEVLRGLAACAAAWTETPAEAPGGGDAQP